MRSETAPALFLNDSPYPIREGVLEAYRELWQRFSEPGDSWTGAQRLAIAQETRNARSCDLCVRRKQQFSPYGLDESHVLTETGEQIGAVAVDSIHRIVTDPARLSRRMVEDARSSGLSDEQIVELIGVACVTMAVDEHYRALGLPLEPLPEPVPGPPSGRRLSEDRLEIGTAYVPMLARDSAVGDEADLWSGRRTAIHIIRALSLVPDALRDLTILSNEQYLTLEEAPAFALQPEGRAIDRLQMELLATRVSQVNECFY